MAKKKSPLPNKIQPPDGIEPPYKEAAPKPGPEQLYVEAQQKELETAFRKGEAEAMAIRNIRNAANTAHPLENPDRAEKSFKARQKTRSEKAKSEMMPAIEAQARRNELTALAGGFTDRNFGIGETWYKSGPKTREQQAVENAGRAGAGRAAAGLPALQGAAGQGGADRSAVDIAESITLGGAKGDDRQAPTKGLTKVYSDALAEFAKGFDTSALSGKTPQEQQDILIGEFLKQPADIGSIKGVADNEFSKSVADAPEELTAGLTNGDTVNINNIQNTFSQVMPGWTAADTIKFYRGGKPITVTDGKGNKHTLDPTDREALMTAVERMREADPDKAGAMEWRELRKGALPPPAEEAEGDGGAPYADTETVLRVKVPEPKPVQIGFSSGPWEYRGPEGLGANGHVSNEQLQAIMLGARMAQEERRNAALATNHKAALNSAYQDVSIWLMQQAAGLANADPQTIQTKLASIEQTLSTNPALSPFADGLTPEMRLERQAALQDTLYKFTAQVERQGIETRIEQTKTDASERIAAIAAKSASGDYANDPRGAAGAVKDFLEVYDSAKDVYSPAERSRFLQEGASAVAAGQLQYEVSQDLKGAAGEPVYNVQRLVDEYTNYGNTMFGAAGETLNEDQLEILKVKVTETVEKARNTLQAYNADVLRRKQAEYENDITQGLTGAAGAIAAGWGGVPRALAQSGAISEEDFYRARDYFKPFTETGTGGGGGGTVYKGPAFDKMGKTLAEAVVNYLQVPANPLPKDVFEILVASTLDAYGLDESAKDTVAASIWRQAAENLRTLNPETQMEAQNFINAVQGDVGVIKAQVKNMPEFGKLKDKSEAEAARDPAFMRTVEDWQQFLFMGALEIISTAKTPQEFNNYADNMRTQGFKDFSVIMDARQSELQNQLAKNGERGVKFETLEKNIVKELEARQNLEDKYGIGYEPLTRSPLTDDNQRALDTAVLGLFGQQMENLMPFISDMNLRYESGVPVIDVLRTGGSRARYIGRVAGNNKLVFEDEAEHGR